MLSPMPMACCIAFHSWAFMPPWTRSSSSPESDGPSMRGPCASGVPRRRHQPTPVDTALRALRRARGWWRANLPVKARELDLLRGLAGLDPAGDAVGHDEHVRVTEAFGAH